MNKLFFILFFILLITNVSALVINEVELNPIGGSTEKEWIELYNENQDEIDVSGWTIYDGLSKPSKIYNFSEGAKIGGKGFYIIETNRKLNNDGDFVTLYDNTGNKIDETPTKKDTSPSYETWQFCDGEWKFLNSTKGEENNCPEEETENNSLTEETNNSETLQEELENETIEEIKETKKVEDIPRENYTASNTSAEELSPISLNSIDSKSIKSEENTEFSSKNLAFFGVIAFCVIFGALFLIKKQKYKNEFN